MLLLAPCVAVTLLCSAQGAEPDRSIGDVLERYIDRLGAYRGGEENALEELRAAGTTLCDAFDRCDALDVVAYYASLSAEQRRRGLELESDYMEVRELVWELGAEGLPHGEDWSLLREEVCADLEEVIDLSEAGGDCTPAARSHTLMAEILLQDVSSPVETESGYQRLTEIQEHVDRAIQLFERAGQVTPQLEPLWLSAKIHRARGEVDRARAKFGECLRQATRLRRDNYRERALLGLVALARDGGDWREVESLLSELAGFQTPADSWPLAREHSKRLLHLDRPETALRFLLAHPPRIAAYDSEWRSLLASAFLRSGDIASAQRELQALEGTNAELRTLARASLELAEGHWDRVIERLSDDKLEIAQASWTAQGRVQAWSFLGEAELAAGRPDAARAWLEKATAGTDGWYDLHAEAGGGSVVGEWLGLHTLVLLARAHIALGSPLEAARVIESFQSRRLRGGRSTIESHELEAFAARFDGGLVTWMIGADHGVVAHVSKNGDAWGAPLQHGRRAFQDAVRRVREALIAGDRKRARELSLEIGREILPKELRVRLLRLNPGSDVLFLPHGPLEALPLSFLELAGDPLDEHLTPVVLPGLVDPDPVEPFHPARLERSDWRLMGSPVAMDGSDHVQLPGAAEELAELADRYPRATLTSGPAFVREAALAALSEERPLHLATHLVTTARCDDVAMAGIGLELSGGDVLCASEIAAARPRLPLVVLTACETAGGRFIDGEGLHGISRAFLIGGSAGVVATLWPVEDTAARAFAVAFHDALRQDADPASATRAARRTLRDSGNAPVDWAAFRFLGTGGTR